MATSKQPQKNLFIPVKLQKIMLGLGLVSFALSNGMIAYWMIQQYPSNHNLSGFYAITASSFVLPLAFFVICYVFSRNRERSLSHIFEAFLFTVLGMILCGVISQIINFIYMRFVTLGSGALEFLIYDLSSFALTLLVFIGLLVYLRKTRAW